MRCCVLLLLAASLHAQGVLVITPEEFRPALKEWQRHRESQGFKVTVRSPDSDAQTNGKGFDYLLLLGDVQQVPCSYHAGEIIKRWERNPRIASDNPRADLDGDSLPDLAVGRLPAATKEAAAALLDKVLAYERNADHSAWCRRVNVIAGVGGFGKMQDWAMERVATLLLTNNIPARFDLNVTYCNPESAYCPPPTEVATTALERFNEGALMVTYLGHGSRMSLDSMRFQKRRYRIFNSRYAKALSAKHGSPIAMLIACSTGYMDGKDCLAQVMLRQPRGPIAVIASSRVSMPYGNGVFAKELMDAIFTAEDEDARPTLGDALMRAKRRTIHAAKDDNDRKFIEMLATPYQPDAKLRSKERAEHLYLYNLFGDPTMRIPLPAKAKIQAIRKGKELEVTGHSPVSGEALIELVSHRTPNRPRRTDDTPEAFRKAYEGANHRQLQKTSLHLPENGDFKTSFGVPRRGKYIVRVFVRGLKGAAAAATRIVIK